MISAADVQFSGMNVELARIEQEFREIWKKTTDDNSQNAVIKAGTLNLVITFNSAERLPAIMQLVPEIISHHPGRIIIVYINPQNPTGQIRASITAFCQPPRFDGKQICCELISLETGPAGEKHLPGTILPLLLPDLPVFLWSPNNLALHSPAFQDFHKNIERLILQTPESLPATADLLQMTEAIINTARLSKISDMNWARLTSWREALSGFFDGTDGVKNLQNISAVHIRYVGDGASFHSYLIAGWLASLLHWEISGAAAPRGEFHFVTPDGKPVVIHIEKSLAEAPVNGVDTITITVLQDHGGKLIFHAGKINGNKIRTTVHQDQLLVSTNDIPVFPIDEGRLLCNELDYLHDDSVYTGAAQAVYKILSSGNNEQSQIY